MSRRNFILSSDSYKASHDLQYPLEMAGAWSYIEPRKLTHPFTKGVLHFGVQAYIKEYLLNPVTKEDVEEAEDILLAHGEPFNKTGWNYIINKYGGYIPVTIESVPEGLVLPARVATVQVHNEDENLRWLNSHIETSLLRGVWYPSSVATISWHIKQLIKEYLHETSDNPDQEILFKLHDFGGRGVSSGESAGLGGLAHLINFRGTDTLEALVAGRKYYGEKMAGFSIPAAEHSTITSWGPGREVDAYRNMLQQFAKPGKLVAVVSDSYDLEYAVETIWGTILHDEVVNSGAIVVVRPDSGRPEVIAPWTVRTLGKKYGYTINSKGYKVLKNVRVIQGDGVNYNSIWDILEALKKDGYSAENIAFGMGGALLQKVDRDTFGYAMKQSARVTINGQVIDVWKDPKTDPGKASKRGILSTIKLNGVYRTIKRSTKIPEMEDLLATVYKDGVLLKEVTFDEVRRNSEI